MGFLLEKGIARIVASDINPDNCDAAVAEFGDAVEVRCTQPGDDSILAEDVDIVSPCAWGGVLNPTTCPTIKAKIVCGAANSQLLDPEDDCGMTARGVIYVPDFVANPMGIVNCANEAYGRIGRLGTTEDPILSDRLGREYERSVFCSTRDVLRLAAEKNVSTAVAANTLADELAAELHPIFGHRSQAIMDDLCATGWADES